MRKGHMEMGDGGGGGGGGGWPDGKLCAQNIIRKHKLLNGSVFNNARVQPFKQSGYFYNIFHFIIMTDGCCLVGVSPRSLVLSGNVFNR